MGGLNLPRYSRRAEKQQKKKDITSEFEFGTISPKGMDSIDNSNARLNIWYGAIRSSKTICSILAWIALLSTSPHTEFLMSGRTRDTLYRNVLYPFFMILNFLGIEYYHDRYIGVIYVLDKVIWTLGYSNEVVSEKIIGMTLAGWYADEVNVYPKQAVEDTLDRMSKEGAKAFWTYNPDTPKHFIDVDYTFNKSKLKKGMVKAWHFILTDNWNLPQEYIDDLLERYKKGTVAYLRKILGVAAIPEGAIYDRFSEALHTFTNESKPYKEYSYYVIGTDEGAGSARVCGLFGIKRNINGDEYHLLDEAYWDVSKHDGRQLTNEELVHGAPGYKFKGALAMLQGKPLSSFIISHEASNLQAYLKQEVYQNKEIPVRKYMPKTIADIELIQEIIAKDRLKVNSDKCPMSVEQIQGYIWDPHAKAKGISKPLKRNDHCPDMIRGPILGTRNLGDDQTIPKFKKTLFNMNDILRDR